MKTPLQQFIALVILVIILIVGSQYYSSKRPEVKETKMFATLSTDKGDIKLELYPKVAPKTVDNFKQLAEKKYYEGITFHRVIKNFMIQTGDPTGTGSGGESAFGKDFKDEINPTDSGLDSATLAKYRSQGYSYDYSLESKKFDVGTVAMANRGPNTNSSQFFITSEGSEDSWISLNGRYTIFGHVVSGQDVVNAIAAVETTEEKPNTEIKIKTVTITEE